MKNQNEGFIVPLLIAIIAILAIGGGIYVYENKKAETPVTTDTTIQTPTQTEQSNSQSIPVDATQNTTSNQTTQTVNSSVSSNTTISTTGWETYYSSQYGFSFQYPSSMVLNPNMEDSSKYNARICNSSTDCSNEVAVVVSTNPQIVASCMSEPQSQGGSGTPAYGTLVINGKTFLSSGIGSAGGGSTNANNSYQIKWGNACYIIMTQLSHPSSVTIDSGIASTLNSIVQSFKFTSATPSQLPVETATINQNSLVSASENPTITGTANNVTLLEVSIMGSDGQYVYWSPKISVSNSNWSVTVSPAIKKGTYTLGVEDWNTNTTLTSGTLTVSN